MPVPLMVAMPVLMMGFVLLALHSMGCCSVSQEICVEQSLNTVRLFKKNTWSPKDFHSSPNLT